MVLVFGVFARHCDRDMKEMGGLAAAILIDATIVRGVLLPATMKLLGRGTWNCRLPRPEWLPNLDTSGRPSRLPSRPRSSPPPQGAPAAATSGGRGCHAPRDGEPLEPSARLGGGPVAAAPGLLVVVMPRRLSSARKVRELELADLLAAVLGRTVGVTMSTDARFGARPRGAREVVGMRRIPDGERTEVAVRPVAVEDDDAARAPERDEAREPVDELAGPEKSPACRGL